MEKLLKIATKIAAEAGKTVGATKLFAAAGAFNAVYKAEEYAIDQGYKVGPMCRDMPMVLSKTAGYIAKWCNISMDEYPRIEGLLLSDDFREGAVLFVELVG